MVAVCVAALERILQILEEEDVTTMPEDSLDTIKTFLEFAYRELVYTDTIDPHTSVTDSIISISRCIRIITQQLDFMVSDNFSVVVDDAGLVGRPRFIISRRQLVFLVEHRFTVPQIADLLGVSVRTVHRRMREYDISISQQYSTVSDLELDQLVGEILAEFPTCGNKQMLGHLLSKGYRVQQCRVRESQRRTDPIGVAGRRLTAVNRRVYSVPAPRSLFHIDGYHKLIRYIIIYPVLIVCIIIDVHVFIIQVEDCDSRLYRWLQSANYLLACQ